MYNLYIVLVLTPEDLWRFEVGAESSREAREYILAYFKYNLEINLATPNHIKIDWFNNTDKLGILDIGAVLSE